jgi:predicted nuclease with TOPRIM domain
MPVTARLSKAFYDRLGEQVANELVDWFNQVDLTYRTELRELNDLNFARFDAKVGERLAELRTGLRSDLEQWFRAELQTESQRLRGGMDSRFATVDERFDKVDERFDKVDERFEKVDERFARVEKRLEVLADQMRDSKTSTIRWVISLWIGTALAVAGSRLVP